MDYSNGQLDPLVLQRLCLTQTAYITKLEGGLHTMNDRLEIAEQRAELVNTAHDYIRNALALTPEQPLRFDYYAQQIAELDAARRAAEQRVIQQQTEIAALQAEVQKLKSLNRGHNHFRGEVAKLMRQHEAYEAGLGKK